MTPRELADNAYTLAAQGWPVFPTNIRKIPCTSHGHLDAVDDPEKARSLFRSFPNAALIAIATGKRSGIAAVDIDPDAIAWFRSIIVRFPETRIDETPRGGYHLYYICPDPPVRCSAGKIHKGCDIRGEGGSIIVAPSPGYVTVHDAPIAPFPTWITRRLNRTPPKLPKDEDGPATSNLENLERFVAQSGNGERNVRAFWGAARAGEMVRAGRVSFSEAKDALVRAAMRAGLDAMEAQTVTMSGLRRGQIEARGRR